MKRPAALPRYVAGALLALLVGVSLAACGDTGTSGTTNTQGGTGRAPGAPPTDRAPAPTPQTTARATATTPR